MNIHSESVLSFPLDKVYQTYRDRLPEIAAYMPDVKEIRALSRDDVAGGVKIHNRWFASAKLPSVAEKVIKPEWMQWDDYATWDDSQRHVDWHLEIPALGDQVRCSGRNSFWEADGGTLVRLTGDLQINLQKLPGMPSFMAKRLVPEVERFILRLITPNLQRVNASLEEFLKQQG